MLLKLIARASCFEASQEALHKNDLVSDAIAHLIAQIMRRPKPHSRSRLPGPSTFPPTSSAATCRPSAAPYGALLSTAQQMTGFLHSQCRPLPELRGPGGGQPLQQVIACRRGITAPALSGYPLSRTLPENVVTAEMCAPQPHAAGASLRPAGSGDRRRGTAAPAGTARQRAGRSVRRLDQFGALRLVDRCAREGALH